jgi:hypothetical protein
MSIRVEEYIRPDGTNPYKTWFDSLDPQAAAKVVTATLRLELGNTSKSNGSQVLVNMSSTGDLAIGSILLRTATLSLFCSVAARSAGNRRI